MKKILIILMILLMPSLAFAQKRGSLKNVFASWYSVTSTQTNISLPFPSRDVSIYNGDDNDIVCVDIEGNTIVNTGGETQPCVINNANRPTAFQLDPDTALNLTDFETSAISLLILDAQQTASPVSVVVTY